MPIFHNVLGVDIPLMPVKSQAGQGITTADVAKLTGGALMNSAIIPHSTMTQMISDSVHAVTMALVLHSTSSSESRPTVFLASEYALLAIMAMTAAPTP